MQNTTRNEVEKILKTFKTAHSSQLPMGVLEINPSSGEPGAGHIGTILGVKVVKAPSLAKGKWVYRNSAGAVLDQS
jgi:hypothetical protein